MTGRDGGRRADDVVRFHTDTGPASLFARVRQVLTGPRRLRLHGGHFADRVTADTPVDDLETFMPDDWDLMLVEARADTGRFVNTTWRRTYPTGDWWVVIGYGDTVRTVYRAEPGKQAKGPSVVTGGPSWDLADRVNTALLDG